MSDPGRSPLRRPWALVKTSLQVILEGLRTFFWEGLKEGLIDLRPLSHVLRLVTIVGLLLVFAFLGSILFGNFLRTHNTIEPLVYESSQSRGLLVPSAAVPLTLVAIVLAWSYLLAGALHVQRAARWAILVIYAFFGLLSLMMGTLSGSGPASPFDLTVIGGVYAGVLVLVITAFILLPHRKLPVALEFILMLSLNTALVVINLLQNTAVQLNTGFPHTTNQITTMADDTFMFIVPSLLFMGLEMANFGFDVAGWAVQAIRRYTQEWIAALLLIVFLGYRLFHLAGSLLSTGISAGQWRAWAGGLILLAGLVLIFLWRQRQKTRGGWPSQGFVFVLILGLTLFQILAAMLSSSASTFFLLNASRPGAVDNLGQLSDLAADVSRAGDWLSRLSNLYREYLFLITAGVGLVIAGVALHRHRATITAFGLVLAWSQGLEWLTEPGRPLEALHYEYADVDVLLLLALTAFTLFKIVPRLVQRKAPVSEGHTPDQSGSAPAAGPTLYVLGLALLGAILTQTSFLDNPFSPFFEFAGVFFLVFGILWNVLTAGGRFANTSTPAFPRASRLLLYVGYILLSVTITHWFIVSHNAYAQMLQSDISAQGFRRYGLVLAYLAFVEAGRPLLGESEPTEEQALPDQQQLIS